jgi:hypothetical protein
MFHFDKDAEDEQLLQQPACNCSAATQMLGLVAWHSPSWLLQARRNALHAQTLCYQHMHRGRAAHGARRRRHHLRAQPARKYACLARHSHRVPAPPRRPHGPHVSARRRSHRHGAPRARLSGQGLAPLRQLVADVLEQDVDRGRVFRAARDLRAAARRVTRRPRAARAGCIAPLTSEPQSAFGGTPSPTLRRPLHCLASSVDVHCA